ncbi:MAG: CNNM domain-containing protein [Verrucomicrobiota bacterium]
MSHDAMHWISIAGWLLVSFCLSGMEAGVFSLSRLRVRQRARAGSGNARRLLAYMDRPEDFLWTILVGNTVANFAAVALILQDLQGWSGGRDWARGPMLLATGLVIYLACELLPKRLFQRMPNRLCLLLLPVFAAIHWLLSPAVFLVGRFAQALLWVTGDRALSGRLFANRDELKALIQSSTGGLSKTERSLINRVLDAQNLTLSRVARSMDAVQSVPATATVDEIRDLCRRRGHTRMPVWNGTGAARRIEGIVSLKDVLHGNPAAGRSTARDWLRPALFLDDSMRIEEALRAFQRSGEHLAIVRGPGGAEVGIVSLSDVLGALFLEVAP